MKKKSCKIQSKNTLDIHKHQDESAIKRLTIATQEAPNAGRNNYAQTY